MRRKVVKTSLLVIALMISITIPIIVVTAKKKEWILDAPIIIDESMPGMTWADWADEPWLKGLGTEEDPYVIKNVVIDGIGLFPFCMVISNSEAYFKIMDCSFSNAISAGLLLVNTQNGVVFKNHFFANGLGEGTGIALISSHYNRIQKNLCDENPVGIYLLSSNNNLLTQNLCTGNIWMGIYILGGSSYNTVTKNDCIDNGGNGINLEYSNDNLISQNLCKRNNWGGIYIGDGSSYNKVTKNDCIENLEGILIFNEASNNEIERNDCSNNNGNGIYLSNNANHNLITMNDCFNNQGTGIVVETSNGNIITKNDCKENLAEGIALKSSDQHIIIDNECSENERSGIHLENSNDNFIMGNDCNENLVSGINLESSFGNFIIENHCSGNLRPNIYLRYSNDNIITQNLCTGGPWGIVIRWSNNNEVTNNDCIENGEGIVIQQEANDNRITDNTCTNNYENGILLVLDANYNIIDQNDCSENLLSGIALMSSSGTIISKNDCNNNGESGISINDFFDINARDNILYGNKIAGNLNGIHFSEADLNDVFRNTIKENDIGMLVEGQSELNLIYQNNFIDNGLQASNEHAGLNNWHNIYMLEGNYWFDYTGTDSDGDGIGDMQWPEEGFDGYPFMEENGWESLTPIEEEILNARDDPETNLLGRGLDYRSNEAGYLIVGLGQLFSERIYDTWIPPYTCRLWFFGTEYSFEGNIWSFEEESNYGEPVWLNLFYLRIPPNIFTDLGLPLGVELNYQWSVSFYSGGEKQYMNITSYFTLI